MGSIPENGALVEIKRSAKSLKSIEAHTFFFAFFFTRIESGSSSMKTENVILYRAWSV